MEPRRGENQEQLAVVPGAALTPPPDSGSSARHALEQAVLSRADLMMQPLLHLPAGDRRRERRMRNRASAQRSRARQHAYVNELETEARLLRQENEQLRSLCDELKGAAKFVLVPPQVVKKKKETAAATTTPQLQRTSSSPF